MGKSLFLFCSYVVNESFNMEKNSSVRINIRIRVSLVQLAPLFGTVFLLWVFLAFPHSHVESPRWEVALLAFTEPSWMAAQVRFGDSCLMLV